MASTSRPKRPTATPANWHQYRAAVLGGLYAAHGTDILMAKPGEYEKVIRSFRRVADDQANEMLRRSAE